MSTISIYYFHLQIRTLIRHLEISECNIEKLYGDVFKPLTVKVRKSTYKGINILKSVRITKVKTID